MRKLALGAVAAAILAVAFVAPDVGRAQGVVNSNGGDGFLGADGRLYDSDNAADFGPGPLPNITSIDLISGFDGTVYLFWGYEDFDRRGTSFDSGGFIFDGTYEEFASDTRRTGGVFGIVLDASDTLGAYVSSADSEGGRAYVSFFWGAFPGHVPEPATWALMVIGLGLVGGTLRRRSAMRPLLIG